MKPGDRAMTTAERVAAGLPSGLRLGIAQERALRQWPKERIRPKSVALGVISLLAEVDHLRAELADLRQKYGALWNVAPSECPLPPSKEGLKP